MSDLNRVVLTCRLTKDPEPLKSLPDGTAILSLRVAFSTRKRDAQGQWGDVPNYVDVTMFGTRAEKLFPLLEKGRLIGVDGKLRWREWQNNEGEKRSAVDISADTIELLGGRSEGSGSGGGGSYSAPAPTQDSSTPVINSEDIPF